ALADTHSTFIELDGWIRRRLRMCLWKEWKKPKTRIRKLIKLGVPAWRAYEWGNSRKGYWRISKSPILHKTIGKSYWKSQGLRSLHERYEFLRYSSYFIRRIRELIVRWRVRYEVNRHLLLDWSQQ